MPQVDTVAPGKRAGKQPQIVRPVLRIQPKKGWLGINFKELWEHRELLYFLTWREVMVRYKQTVLGVAWAILQPLFTMLIFTIFFGRLAKIPSDGIPYPVFALAGLVPWTFFANGLTLSSASLVNSAGLVSKVYFPRLMVPMAAVFCGLVDMAFSLVLLLGLIFWYHIPLGWNALYAPAFIALATVACLGVGLFAAALNVKYRDVRHTIPFLVQFWLFATPIAYPSSLLHGKWQAIYGLNPMVGVVEGFRWALLGAKTHPGPQLIFSCAAAMVMMLVGALYFRRTEREFADVI
jgi:lipopolysaccharide transport system permease protein